MNSSPTAPAKLDLKKELKALYTGKAGVVSRVTPGSHRFLCCHGSGDPNTSDAYRAGVEALFSVSYALKFGAGKKRGRDYVVMPLEGLWWSDDMSAFRRNDRTGWRWTMMIMQPSFIEQEDVSSTKRSVADRGVQSADLTLEDYTEGSCAQILHVGPFDQEGPTIDRLHESITSAGHTLDGKHHEIYLTDIRRVPASQWKTLIRQPFR